MMQLPFGGRRKPPFRQLSGLQIHRGGDAKKEVAEDTQDYNLTTPGVSFAVALRGRTEEQQQPQTHQVAVAGPTTMEPRVPAALPQHEQQTATQSVRVTNVNSLPLDKTLRVVVVMVV
jgi:hypothetical protein